MPDDKKLMFDDEDETFVAWGLGWAFWIQWILANTIGWSLGPMAQQALIEISQTSRSQVAMGLAIGLMAGLAQWFIFLPQPYKTGLWWVLVNIAGWGIGWPLGWFIGWGWFSGASFSFVYGLIGFSGGLAAGVGQWFILRNQVRQAGWWIPVSGLGWSIALAVVFALTRDWGWTITGGVAAALTGGPLIWLLRHPFNESLRRWIDPAK